MLTINASDKQKRKGWGWVGMSGAECAVEGTGRQAGEEPTISLVVHKKVHRIAA